MLVFLVSGKAGHGKDTFYEIIKKEYGMYLSIHRMAYADSVKKIARELGWNGEKDTKGRSFLQWLGDGARSYNPNVWVDCLLREMKKNKVYPDILVITDCRYPNEIEEMEKRFKCVKVRIHRTYYESNLTEAQLNHPSETALGDVRMDYIIDNDDYEDFKQKVLRVFDKEWARCKHCKP